ncbi:8120_t:CDS:1, partial [Racocetra persica]
MEDRNIEGFFEVACKKQPKIEIAILTWIIDDCQPFYLLQFKTFKSFMEVACPEFNVPSDDKAQCIINNAYVQSIEQLTELLQDTYSVNITTDLWSSHSDELYIGVMARWIDSKNWSLKEVLLVCEKINERHTDKNIKDVIEEVIRQFQLNQKLFAATTNNGANIVKAIWLMEISHVLCAAHTLHLSIIKGLNAASIFK